MSEPDNMRDLLSTLPEEHSRSTRNVVDLVDGSVKASRTEVSGKVPTDDAAWTSLRQRLGLGIRPSVRPRLRGAADRDAVQAGRRIQPVSRVRTVTLSTLVAAAACLALAVWFFQPREFVAASGQQEQLTLPDGSTVELNSGSRIRYARSIGLPAWIRDTRAVKLDGEAYFDVTHDEAHPFVVETGNAAVTVLGTQFNVRSRMVSGDRSTVVTLISGSVRLDGRRVEGVAAANGNEPGVFDTQNASDDAVGGAEAASGQFGTGVVLTPGQTAVVDETRVPRLRDGVQPDRAVTWRSGGFSYSSEPLGLIADEVARRYRVQIETDEAVDTAQLMTLHYAGEVSADLIIHDLCLGANLQYRRISGGYQLIPAAPTD